MTTHKIKSGRVTGQSADSFVGNYGQLFYDESDGQLRISDGVTPGGNVVGGGGGGSYTLPTASTSTKGGVKVDGTTITINNQIISATQQDLSSYATQTYVTTRGYITSSALSGYATETFVTTRGYLTSVGTISYNDLSNKPTLFSGSYTDLTNKPTLFDGAYASLTGKPTLFSGSYTDLTDKPTIPTTVTVNGTSITLGSSGTVTAAAGTLTGTTLNSTVVSSSLTSVGTLTNLSVTNTITGSISGNAGTVTNGVYTTDTGTVTNTMLAGSIANAKLANSAVTVNGTSISLGSSATVTAAAGTLTGSTLASGVTASSLTSVGTLTNITVNSTSSTAVSITADGRPGSETNNWSFVSNQSIGGPRAWIQFPDSTLQSTAYTGNAATVTNGVYTTDTGTVTNTMLAGSIANDKLSNSSITVNGTSIALGASGTVTAAAGTLTGTTLNSTVVSSSLTSVGTLTGVTSNAVTAFTAGDAAISGVALQVPREGAIRNLYNGAANNMYFDVSIGGTSQGQFQFRSSSAYTNILTMSPTAFNVNADAVVTARTASFGRTAWNAAIDTELTIDEYRFRVTNSGGIYPQIISNVSGQTKNSAWTSVAAISGQAIGQGGSTGTLVPNNAWTNLYTFAAMNAAGDTVTVTLQDKALGRIYRVTFMRSDNGSTTGYNIIAERLL